MLILEIPEHELYDEENNEFLIYPFMKLKLEHSLISISDWETKWHEAFLSKKELTNEQLIDYIRCMVIGNDVDNHVIDYITRYYIDAIKEYISNPASATKIFDIKQSAPNRKETMTSELIYYYMIFFNIPFECEKWRLNRLFNLIKICSIKYNEKNGDNRMSRNDIYKNNREINALRRAKYKSKG